MATSVAPTPKPTVSRAALPPAVTRRLHVGRSLGGPGFPGGWVVAFGSVWVPEGQTGQLTRFDQQTGSPTVIKVGDPAKDPAGVDPNAAVAAGDRIAVTSRAAKAVALVDPATSAVVGTVDVGVAAYGIAVQGDTVWATDFENGLVTRASIRTGKVVGRTQVPGPEGVVATASAAWVASETGALYRVDVTTGAALAVPGVSGGNLETLAFGAGSVWALDKMAGVVYRVDPTTSRVKAKVPVVLGEQADAGICFGAGTLWVVGSPAGRNVLGISASTNRLATGASLPVSTQSCAFGGSLVWTISGESSSDGDEILGIDPRKLS
ncbi:MAG: hypothetical protein M3P04_04855 [Actinomycetota bacterium]|nr:hypothetical protein [Actinomycetota bacterium]